MAVKKVSYSEDDLKFSERLKNNLKRFVNLFYDVSYL